MRRYTIQLLLVSLSWFWLTTSCTHREARFRIGVSQCSDDEWRHQMNNEMLREALFYDGVEIDIRTVKDDNAEQIKDIRNFIKEGVDLLVVAPNEAAPITPVVEEAFDRGIPVIVFDRKILSDKYTAYIGADNYELGKAIGNYVANMLHGQGNVVEIAGLTGSTPAMDRHQGFVAAISPYPGIQLLAREDAGWLRSEAGEKMDTLLARFPEIDVVYAQNDRMAAGAYDVAERQGRAEEMRFIGTDALPGEGYGVEQVLDGQLDATFIYPTGGDRVIQMAMDILNKRDFPRETILSTSVVDATNAQIMQMQTSHIATLDEKIETMNGKMSQFLDRYATQQVILYGSLLVLLLVIGLLVAVYLSLRTKNRLNRELSRQKEKLEEQKQQLTQQKELLIQQKEQLEQLSRELEEATHAKLVFFTNVSHDFRTPLTLIKGPLENIILKKQVDAETREDLNVMKQNTERLLNLVNQLLDFRKTESQGFRLNFTECNVTEILKETHKRFTSLAKQKGLNFVLNVPEQDFYAHINQEAFTKIISNLLNNAVKYAESYVHISLEVPDTDDDKSFRIRTDNDGVIIPDEMKEEIFKPFARFNEKEDGKVTTGTGIGLALSRSLAELHQGTLAMEKGERSNIFCLTLPIIQDMTITLTPEVEVEMDKMKEAPAEHIDKKDNRPTILVVEDNPDMLSFVVRQLSKEYMVLTATNGVEGLQLLDGNYVNLVVSDVVMPVMDGFELCKTIKSDLNYSHIPIILLTAKTNIQSKIEGMELGADAYIEKPFSVEYLQACASNLIQNREKLRRTFAKSPFVAANTMALTKADEEFIKKLNEVIQINYTNPEFSMDDMADNLNMSRSNFYRKIKGVLDLSPNEYLRLERLKRAAQLLKDGENRISEICYMVGFNSPSYFAKCFQKQFGVSPKDFAS